MFEAINIADDLEAQARLRALGLHVPAVVIGNRGIEAIALRDVAEFLGRVYRRPPQLAPPSLLVRLDGVLSAARRYVRQVSDEQRAFRFPDRDRTFGQIAYHVFVIPRMFVDGARSGELPISMLFAQPAADTTVDQFADFGATTQEQVHAWWRASGASDDYERQIDTGQYNGVRSLHDVFERETWHAAQHTRQLLLFLEEMQIEPDGPLGSDALAGLPLPRGVWDEGR